MGIAYRKDGGIYGVLFQTGMWIFQISGAINKCVRFQQISVIAKHNICTLFKNDLYLIQHMKPFFGFEVLLFTQFWIFGGSKK